ncbi:AMP-binding protein [Entomomonas asaccharolytica]|uniref:AMP-binding protein n=1 Tax=Entomomonas asaccharolytica TaxID=2785331 RepID=A0A974RVU5_9GAMM|nr:AMP-binding protein [Entomomonas asaccharolytica]QQP84546.1 AMP-binding protein [Entomomonas asaccharolytica]
MDNLLLTPTKNKVLPFKTSGFKSLVDGLEYAAKGESGFNFYNSQAELISVLSYTDLLNQAIKMAHHLLAIGLKKGDHLPIIAENRPEFLVVFYACQCLGVIVCPLPMISSAAERSNFAEKTLQLVKLTNARLIVTSEALIKTFFTENNTNLQFISFENLATESAKQSLTTSTTPFSPIENKGVSFIQFSSGSTSQPKGITIHNHDVCEHVQVVLEDVMKLQADDRSLSWLPFYHNMGLIGFIIASVNGQRSVDCFSPLTFVSNPALWLKLMSANQTAITYAPMFAYQLAIKVFDEQSFAGLDLSSIRVAGIGGDAIHIDIMKKFQQVYAPYGFNYQAFLPSYGMTEAIMAISGKIADEQVVTDMFEEKQIVSCGTVLPDCQLKIVDDNNTPLPERSVGSILFKKKAITGVLHKQSESIALSSQDNYIDTGDIGYLYKQNLFVLGRKKDVILIRGRNIWAQDIKTSLINTNTWLKLEDILVMGIEVNQEEKLVVMIQRDGEHKDNLALAKKIKGQISQQFSVLADIVFVRAGGLPLTPSGKVSRERFTEIYLTQTSLF